MPDPSHYLNKEASRKSAPLAVLKAFFLLYVIPLGLELSPFAAQK
jgi:hypothetical protein